MWFLVKGVDVHSTDLLGHKSLNILLKLGWVDRFGITRQRAVFRHLRGIHIMYLQYVSTQNFRLFSLDQRMELFASGMQLHIGKDYLISRFWAMAEVFLYGLCLQLWFIFLNVSLIQVKLGYNLWSEDDRLCICIWCILKLQRFLVLFMFLCCTDNFKFFKSFFLFT